MRKIYSSFFANCRGDKLIFLTLALLSVIKISAQPCDPFTNPSLFGAPPQTAIYCKNTSVPFGVFNSRTGQIYFFSVYKNGVVKSTKGGPLDGNGNQLSVAAKMLSAQDAGEYGVKTYNECGDTGFVSFQAFYGSIDNLRITSWGSNAVTFKWAASGPALAVTYEYAVTSEADPNSSSITYHTTTDTTASEPGLTAGATYYIHVRVQGAFWDGEDVIQSFDCPGGNLPWQTVRFVSCSGVAAAGSITPANAIACVGGTATFTATGGNTYQWYDENNSLIAGAASSTYAASLPGQYKIYVTTNSGCQGMVSSATLTQTSLETGIFSGGGCHNTGDSVRLGISKTIIGQTYKILNGGVEVATLQGIGRAAFESEDTIWYNFKLISATQFGHYTVRVSNPYCTAIDFGDLAVSGYGTWSGTLNSNWQNPANWVCGVVPGTNTDVVIPEEGVTNMPLINSNVSCRSVNVQPGATLTVATGFKLTITGN